jgi:sugar phosphate isomerase/epimerase
VHLPLDLKLTCSDPDVVHPSIDKAKRTIEATRCLGPWAYVVHLDGSEIAGKPEATALRTWRDQATRSVSLIGEAAGDLQLLAIENLESYSADAYLPMARALGASLCVDIGHLLKRGSGATRLLRHDMSAVRVVHIHGCSNGRDHLSLDHLPEGVLHEVLDRLLGSGYIGVLTLELFSESDFFRSREMILSLCEELV